MSKEYLEALERLAMPDELHIKECKRLGIGLTVDYDTLKQYFEAIDQSNPSEALEELEKIKNRYDMLEIKYVFGNPKEKPIPLLNFNTIKQALLKSQEQEKENDILKGQVKYLTEVVIEFQKLLKVIFEKNVSIFWIKECKSLEEYNYNVADYMKLTEEEYDLLKRYCDDR